MAAAAYVCRIEDLAPSWMWSGRASIAAWVKRCKMRPNYRGIADYLEPHYLELMRKSGGSTVGGYSDLAWVALSRISRCT